MIKNSTQNNQQYFFVTLIKNKQPAADEKKIISFALCRRVSSRTYMLEFSSQSSPGPGLKFYRGPAPKYLKGPGPPWLLLQRQYIISWRKNRAETHFSKRKSDLRQICIQFLTPFLTLFIIPFHMAVMIHFVQSLNSKKHLNIEVSYWLFENFHHLNRGFRGQHSVGTHTI